MYRYLVASLILTSLAFGQDATPFKVKSEAEARRDSCALNLWDCNLSPADNRIKVKSELDVCVEELAKEYEHGEAVTAGRDNLLSEITSSHARIEELAKEYDALVERFNANVREHNELVKNHNELIGLLSAATAPTSAPSFSWNNLIRSSIMGGLAASQQQAPPAVYCSTTNWGTTSYTSCHP